MKKIHFLASVILIMLLASLVLVLSFQSRNKKNQLPILVSSTDANYSKNSFSLPKEMQQSEKNYARFAQMSDVPKIEKIETFSYAKLNSSPPHISLNVPYSEKWTVQGKPLQKFYLSTVFPNELISISFGKFLYGGTFMTSEYNLTLLPIDSGDSLEKIRILKEKQGNCFSEKPVIVTYSNIKGVLSGEQDGTGCSTVFTTYINKYVIELLRFSGTEKKDYKLTDEMKEIIKSVKIEK